MPLLEAAGLSKSFPGVRALDDVSMHLDAGEVLAVVGENGAGKSTLMKILAGVYQPDAGTLTFDGQPVRFAGVADAQAQGISLIHQELNLAENLTVAENLFLGREPTYLGLWLARGPMRSAARKLLDRVGLDVSPDACVGDLPPGRRQLVEIARSLSLNARVLIMDEPTSSLSQSETDRLYEVIDDLARSGVAVVYISHRLAEVKRLAHRVTVLRDGKNAGELPRDEVSHESLVRLMVGRDLQQVYPRARTETGPVRLSVRELTFVGGKAPLSLEVRGGEVVGLAGLVGAGRTELAEALFGMRVITGGSFRIDDRVIDGSRPTDAIAAGLALVPEDRRRHGLVLQEAIRANLSLPNLAGLATLGFVRRGDERRQAQSLAHRLHVRCAGLGQVVGQLSGGNQQKVVLGKWLGRSPKVLVCDEPTRGVDVGARAEIYALLDQLAGQGVAVLMISSDLEEILGMSDRVLVLHEGRLAGELPRSRMSEEAVMRLATGMTA